MKKFLLLASCTMLTALFAVSCSDSDDTSSPGNAETLATPTLSIDMSSISSTGFTVNWSAVAHAASYLYKIDDGAEQPAANTSVTLTDLAPGQTYTISVKAVSGDRTQYLDSAWASAIATTGSSDNQPNPLVAPIPKVVGGSVTGTGFSITWTAVEHAASYLYKIDDGAETEISETTVTLTDLTPGQTYTVAVKAVSDDKTQYRDSAWGSVTATTDSNAVPDPTPLTAPAPKADNASITENGFTVTWDAVEHAASYTYRIDEGVKQSVSGTSVTITGLISDHTYTISVMAVSENPDLYLDSDWGSVTVTTASMANKPVYAVGDYYKQGSDEGIVVYIEEGSGGTSGMIMSMDETQTVWSTESGVMVIGYNLYYGQSNTNKVCQLEDWETKYPGFKWCVDHGTGWFFPAKYEMEEVVRAFTGGYKEDEAEKEKEAEDRLNQTIIAHGGEPLSNSTYWTSTELNRYDGVWIFMGINNVTCIDTDKDIMLCVRAAKYF